MICRIALLLFAVCIAVSAQSKYTGPRPPKPDLPYLKHASNLVPTESGMAREEKKKDDITYIVEGATSTARTPLASPVQSPIAAWPTSNLRPDSEPSAA